MKVLALGCGDMGRMAIITLLNSLKVTSITVADKDIELAKIFCELVGSGKLSAIEIDVTEQDKLIRLISEHDIVVNSVGPYFKFGKMILKAVIAAKKDYVDLCDDWKPMLEMLAMDEAAKKAGITAILGIGASPGVLNLLAVMACSKFDEIDNIVMGWGLGNTKGGKIPKNFVRKKKILKNFETQEKKSNAALVHLIHECIGKIPTFKNGEIVEINAFSEAPPFQFPGMKDYYAVNVGHPEPVTISRTIKANSISNVMYLTKTISDKLRDYVNQINKNELTIDEAAIIIEKELTKVKNYILLFWELLKRFFKVPPELCVIVTGLKDGKRKKVAMGVKYRPWGEVEEGMDGITGVPMAIAALMIIDRKIKEKGVLTPEESIDPSEFFEIYAKYCKKNLQVKDVIITKELWI